MNVVIRVAVAAAFGTSEGVSYRVYRSGDSRAEGNTFTHVATVKSAHGPRHTHFRYRCQCDLEQAAGVCLHLGLRPAIAQRPLEPADRAPRAPRSVILPPFGSNQQRIYRRAGIARMLHRVRSAA